MPSIVTYVKAFLIAAVLVAILRAEEGYSIRTTPDDLTLMEPSVRRRSLQLFREDAAMPPRGSIVWFEHPDFPGKMLISRVVAIEGDRVGLEDGKLVRDGEVVAEDYAQRRVANEDLEEIVVPASCVYVLNDARDDPWSAFKDSRRLGPVPVATVAGRLPDPAAEKRAAEGKRSPERDVRGAKRP